MGNKNTVLTVSANIIKGEGDMVAASRTPMANQQLQPSFLTP